MPDDSKSTDLTENDISHLLGTMAEDKLLKERYSEKDKELVYSLSMKGQADAVKLMKTDEGALYLWQIFMKMTEKDLPDPIERFLKCAEFLKEEVGVNLLRVIERNEKKIQGFKIKKKDENYKKMVNYFD